MTAARDTGGAAFTPNALAEFAMPDTGSNAADDHFFADLFLSGFRFYRRWRGGPWYRIQGEHHGVIPADVPRIYRHWSQVPPHPDAAGCRIVATEEHPVR